MNDFLTLYHDEIVFLFMIVVAVVVSYLTDCGTFEKHKSIKWKVRLVALPIIYVAFLFFNKGPWNIDYFLWNVFLAVIVWLAAFFPPWYIWDLLMPDDDGDKKK